MADDALITAIPDNVPPELVYDLDFYAVGGDAADIQAAWLDVRSRAPGEIFWTPRYGGHWVAVRAEDIELFQMDYERFSNSPATTIPITDHQRQFPTPPVDADPPHSTPFRALIMPALVPKEVGRLTEGVRQVAIDLIETLKPQGGCEFMSAFSRVLPVVVFLRMADLPLDDRLKLLEWANDDLSGSKELRESAQTQMRDYVNGWVDKRAADPGEDLISRVATAQINGRPITRDEAAGVCHLMVSAGLETVANMLGYVAWRLAESAQARRIARDSLDDPQRLRAIIEELIRRHGLNNLARRVVGDIDYKGLSFRKDDLILLPYVLVGLDEAKVERPLELDFSREMPIYHATFGNGVHTCPGASLARREIMIFMQEWLTRIPEFEVTPGTRPISKSGLSNAMLELQLSWPAGA